MAETLEQKLKRIEQGDEELRRFFMRTMRPNAPMYVSDFVIIGAVKRTLALSGGFRGHIRGRNFTCAAALLRLQLDTALRLYGAQLHRNSEEYANAIFRGDRIDKLKDRSGHRMTDNYLADKLSQKYPWVKRMYVELCDFIHFSNRHFFTSIQKLDDDARTVYISYRHRRPHPTRQ